MAFVASNDQHGNEIMRVVLCSEPGKRTVASCHNLRINCAPQQMLPDTRQGRYDHRHRFHYFADATPSQREDMLPLQEPHILRQQERHQQQSIIELGELEKEQETQSFMPQWPKRQKSQQEKTHREKQEQEQEKCQQDMVQEIRLQRENSKLEKSQLEWSEEEVFQQEKMRRENSRLEKLKLEKLKLEKLKLEKLKLEKFNMEQLKLEELQLEKLKQEKFKLEKLKLEKMKLEKLRLDKSQREKTQLEKTRLEKFLQEKFPQEKFPQEKSPQISPQKSPHKSPQEKWPHEKTQQPKIQWETSKVEKLQLDWSEQEKSQHVRAQPEKFQQEKPQQKNMQREKSKLGSFEQEKSKLEKIQQETSQQEKAQQEKSQHKKMQQVKTKLESFEQKSPEEMSMLEKTQRETTELEKFQQEKSQLEKTQQEKSQKKMQPEYLKLEKSQLEKSKLEKSKLEKSQQGKPDQDKSQWETAETEWCQREKYHQDRSQTNHHHQQDKSQLEKYRQEKQQRKKLQLEKSQLEKSIPEMLEETHSQREKQELDKSQKMQLEKQRQKKLQMEMFESSKLENAEPEKQHNKSQSQPFEREKLNASLADAALWNSVEINAHSTLLSEKEKIFPRRNSANGSTTSPNSPFYCWLAAKNEVKQQQALDRRLTAELEDQRAEERARLAQQKYEHWMRAKASQLRRAKSDVSSMQTATTSRQSLSATDAQRRLLDWEREKLAELKAQRLQRDALAAQQHLIETTRRELSTEAWEQWVAAARNRPKPVAIGRGLDSLRATNAPHFRNPNEWQSVLPAAQQTAEMETLQQPPQPPRNGPDYERLKRLAQPRRKLWRRTFEEVKPESHLAQSPSNSNSNSNSKSHSHSHSHSHSQAELAMFGSCGQLSNTESPLQPQRTPVVWSRNNAQRVRELRRGVHVGAEGLEPRQLRDDQVEQLRQQQDRQNSKVLPRKFQEKRDQLREKLRGWLEEGKALPDRAFSDVSRDPQQELKEELKHEHRQQQRRAVLVEEHDDNQRDDRRKLSLTETCVQRSEEQLQSTARKSNGPTQRARSTEPKRQLKGRDSKEAQKSRPWR